MGYFKFSSFCICVVSKFSAVNMYYFYNKDKIITTDLAKGFSDSLTREGVWGGSPPCTLRVPCLPWGPLGPYTQSCRLPGTPGWAELKLVFSSVEVTPDPFLAGRFMILCV